MDEILVKYLLDETNTEEERLVQEWIAAKEENKHYFEQFKLIWEESKRLALESKVDENEAWARFKEKINSKEADNVVPLPPPKKTISLKAAAGVAVLLLGAWVAYFFASPQSGMITIASGGFTRIDTLPDGSVVTLNSNSSIVYPKNFKGSNRPVKLEGEAFFNVSPDKNKPFEITVEEVTVQVIGTSFNIRNTKERTEVIVETGIVTVSKKKNSVRLLPKQIAIVGKNADVPLVEKNNDDLYNYYRTKAFVCNNTPLYKLVDALNHAYSVHIIIANDEIRNLPLTTTFHEDSLNNILNTVVETFNIGIEQKSDTIILK